MAVRQWLMDEDPNFKHMSTTDKDKRESEAFFGIEIRLNKALHALNDRKKDHKTSIHCYTDWTYRHNKALIMVYNDFGFDGWMEFDDFCYNRWRSIENVRKYY
jgi:hypothetical protein